MDGFNAVCALLHGVVCGLVAVLGTVCVREGSVTATALPRSLGRRVLAEHPVCTSRAQVYSVCSSYKVWAGAVASTFAASTAGRVQDSLLSRPITLFRVWASAAAGSVGLAVTLRLQAGVSRQVLGAGVSVCGVCGRALQPCIGCRTCHGGRSDERELQHCSGSVQVSFAIWLVSLGQYRRDGVALLRNKSICILVWKQVYLHVPHSRVDAVQKPLTAAVH